MHVLDTNEVFWTTFYTYDRIMELGWKNWPDAFALYVKLIKQSRIQQTDQTRTLNNFLKKWLGWWDERLKKARGVLKQLWLIDDVIIRWDEGKIEWHYVRVNFLINEQNIRSSCITYDLSTEALNHDVDKSTCGETDTNALSTKYINAWSTKNKSLSLGEEKEKEKDEIPSVRVLLEAYRNNERLTHKLKNEEALKQFLNYKQKAKSRAYKTVNWFIQQMIVNINLISYWEIRYDVDLRFQFAVNELLEHEWKWLVRDDKTERKYQWWLKIYSLDNKNE